MTEHIFPCNSSVPIAQLPLTEHCPLTEYFNRHPNPNQAETNANKYMVGEDILTDTKIVL